MTLTPRRIQSMNAALEAECPVCQCRMVVPIEIPTCGHKFCFTCLKGVCMNNMGGCPLCRGPIDPNIFNLASQVLDVKMDVPISPALQPKPKHAKTSLNDENVTPLDLDASLSDQPKKMYWLYRGKNQGWWRFDPRHEKDIEDAFTSDQNYCEVFICGKAYIIDFEEQAQFPKSNPTQRREVKRVSAEEFDGLDVKGLAGVFVPTA